MNVPVLDFGVVIDKVTVFAGTSSSRAITASSGETTSWPVRARAGDHRILIGELRIEASADLDDQEAHLLARHLAGALADGLSSLQAKRMESLSRSTKDAGSIWIRKLHARLSGSHSRQHSTTSRLLLEAIERNLAFQ